MGWMRRGCLEIGLIHWWIGEYFFKSGFCLGQGAAVRPVTVAAEAGSTTGAPTGTTEEEKFIEVCLWN